ncbi:MATE family efflux transporter [Ihubacter sp. mB4P-1]|uniref:MATE family efflux transporter n=1 Tax=Ihubacter sp. mB4P-1 TaxID=3242370 RepID=UPI003C7C1C32
MKDMDRKNGITEGIIWQQILLFFFPILIGTFFQQLYNTADAVIVGRFVGKQALAAVGTTSTMINLLIDFFVGISTGATVIISRFFGAKDWTRLSKAVHTAAAMAFIGGIVLTAAGIGTARPVLLLLETPERVIEDAELYLYVYYISLTASLFYNMCTGILRAVGDSKTPLYILMVCCGANIFLDLLFVAVCRWGICGAALATALSQILSAFLVGYCLIRTEEPYGLQIKQIRMDKPLLKEMLRIGMPTGLQSVLYSLSYLVVQAGVNVLGMESIAAWAAVGRLDGFIWLVMKAFGISITTFTSQNFGAQHFTRVKKGTMVCLLMTMGAIGMLSMLLLVFAKPLLGLFTDDNDVLMIGKTFLWTMGPFYCVFVFVEIFSRTIQGGGEALLPMLINCFGTCVLRTLWVALIVPLAPSARLLALGYPITWAIPAVIFIVYYCRMNWLKRCINRMGDAG